MRKRKYFNLRFARRTKRARIITAVIISLTILLAGLFAYGRIIEVYANQIMGDALVSLINNQSSSRFKITYDSIRVKAFSNKVSVTNFKIIDDRKLKGTSGQRINATIPFLHLDVDGILLVLLTNRLNVNNVRVSQPKIDIINYTAGDKIQLSKETGNFIKILRAQLHLLEIDHLSLEHANFDYYEQKEAQLKHLLHVPDLSLKLENFEWDIDGTDIEDLDSDGLLVEINNQQLSLPDSSYEISFDQLVFSLSRDELILSNVSLFDTRSKKINEKNNQEPLSLNFPELRISGIDYSTAFDDNTLEIETIELIEPKLAILDSEHSEKSDDNSKKSLRKSITSVFDKVFIDMIKLSDGKGDVVLSYKGDYQRFYSDRLNLTISKLKLDTTEIQTEQGYLSYQSIQLSVENYKSIIGDSVNQLSIKKLDYTTAEQTIVADSLILQPIALARNREKNFAKVVVPKLKILGFDEEQLTSDGKLVMNGITLINASADLRLKKQKPDSSKQQSINEIIGQTLNGKIEEINIKNISLASFNVKVVTAENVDLKIYDGTIHSEGFKWSKDYKILQNVPSISAQFTEMSVRIPKQKVNVNLKYADIDLLNNKVKIKDVKVDQEDTNIGIHNLNTKFSNWTSKSLIDSLHMHYLAFEDYTIKWKQTDTKSDHPKQKSFFIKIDSLNFQNGNIKLDLSNGRNISGQISMVKSDSLVIGEKVIFKELLYKMSDINYRDKHTDLAIEILGFNTEQSQLEMTGVEVGKSLKKDSLHLKAPLIKLTKIEIDRLLKNQQLIFDEINLSNWRVSVHDHSGNRLRAKSKSSTDLGPFKEVRFNKLILENGQLGLNGIDGSPAEIDLEFHDIYIDSTFSRLYDPSNILFAKEMQGEIKNLSYTDNDLKVDWQRLKFLPERSLFLTNAKIDKGKDNHIYIDSMYINKVGINDLYSRGKLKAATLDIFQPNIKLDIRKNESNNNRTMAIELDEISVHSATIDIAIREQQRIQLDPVDMELRKLRVDSTVDMSKALLPVQSMSLTTHDMKFATADGLSEILIGSVNLSSDIHGFKIKDIRINPLYTREEYMIRRGYEGDWMKATIDEIELDDLDYIRLLNEKALVSRYIKMVNPKLTVYRDKNLKDSLPDFRPMPATFLQKLETVVDIDSVQISNASITYEEVPEKGEEPGRLTFDSFNGKIYNITNVPGHIQLNPKMRMDVSTNVAGVPFKAGFRFFLDSNNDAFELSGQLESNQMTRFNTITENTAFVKVESGKCRRLNFTAMANNDVSYGSMYFQYSNLKVALVDKQTSETSGIDESLMSFFANTFLIKKNNLALIKLRKGDIYFERNKQKSIFNYLSKTFLSGVSSSVGLKNFKKEVRQLQEEKETIAKK